ncbi:MAG TPA: DUF4193 family protein [Acidimicrobiia bacterium]
MSDDDFEDAPDLELDDEIDEDDSLDEDVLVDDVEEVADDLLTDDLLVDDLPLIPEVPVAVVTDDPTTETAEEEDDDVVDLDEELHPDDVEDPLDVLLQERTASATLEDDEEELEEEDADADDRADGPTRIVPRRPGEFLCSSCFLVLPRNQLADEGRMLCRDCA